MPWVRVLWSSVGENAVQGMLSGRCRYGCAGRSRETKPATVDRDAQAREHGPAHRPRLPDVRTQVKVFAAERGTTVHALVCEGPERGVREAPGVQRSAGSRGHEAQYCAQIAVGLIRRRQCGQNLFQARRVVRYAATRTG